MRLRPTVSLFKMHQVGFLLFFQAVQENQQQHKVTDAFCPGRPNDKWQVKDTLTWKEQKEKQQKGKKQKM